MDVKARLLAVGAQLVDTRGAAFGDESPRRGYFCAIFDSSADLVPVAAFAMTKVAPIMHGISAPARVPWEGRVSRTSGSRR